MYGRGYRGGTGMGFGPPVTPLIVKQLLVANLAIFIAQVLIPGLVGVGAVWPYRFWQEGYFWQPFTYMWLHAGLGHIGMNMFVLWMFGSPLAMAWGARSFLRFYLICGLGAGFIIATLPYLLVYTGARPAVDLMIPTLGASGAIYGVLLGFSLTWPDRTIMLIFPPVAFRAIWLIPALFFMEFAFGAQNVSHVGHLGGVAVAWVYLQRSGGGGRLLPKWSQLQYRWRRYRMRRRLRAVRDEELRFQRQRRDERRTLH